ncbi:hypothetical protein JCM8097_000130 [Rhodosporidiobolus ruineniae]
MSRLTSILTLLPLLSLVLVLAPRPVRAQYDISAPACCRDCYSSVLSAVSAGDFPGLTTGDTVGRCASDDFGSALMDCWTDACTDDADIATGQSIWDTTCNFAASTSSLAAEVTSSVLAKIATDEAFAAVMKIEARATAVAGPALDKRAPDSTSAASDVVHSRLGKSVALVVGAPTLAAVVFIFA